MRRRLTEESCWPDCDALKENVTALVQSTSTLVEKQQDPAVWIVRAILIGFVVLGCCGCLWGLRGPPTTAASAEIKLPPASAALAPGVSLLVAPSNLPLPPISIARQYSTASNTATTPPAVERDMQDPARSSSVIVTNI
jgi:hypothetical protein